MLLFREDRDTLSIADKRSNKRVPANINIHFSMDNLFYTGTITDLSETGMFIRTRKCPPDRSILALLASAEGRQYRFIAKVIRSEETGNLNKGIGIKILNAKQPIKDLYNNSKLNNRQKIHSML